MHLFRFTDKKRDVSLFRKHSSSWESLSTGVKTQGHLYVLRNSYTCIFNSLTVAQIPLPTHCMKLLQVASKFLAGYTTQNS